MNVWLVVISEPLPSDAGATRLLRMGQLRECLLSRGHTVTFWTSTFDHVSKTHRAKETRVDKQGAGSVEVLLHGRAYKKHVSISRIINHIQVARAFSKKSCALSAPDVILVSFPSLELALSVVNFGRNMNIPVVVDIRDLWPDIFFDLAPESLRWLATILSICPA